MDPASWLLLTVALAGPPQQAPVVAVPQTVIRANFDPAAPQQRQPTGERPLPPDERPHLVGVGSALTATSQGIGGATRVFFNDRIGVDFVAAWYNPPNRNTTGSVFNVTPSFIYMLKLPNDLANIDIRPYIGGGLSYVYSSYRATGTVYTGSDSGIGGQVFGGAEVTFKEAQFVTISFEGRYYSLPGRSVNVNMIDGMNFMMMFHFYLK